MKNVVLTLAILMVGSATLASEGTQSLSCTIWDSSTNETIVLSEKDKADDANGLNIYKVNTSKGSVVITSVEGNTSIIAPYLKENQAMAQGSGKVSLQVDSLFINCQPK